MSGDQLPEDHHFARHCSRKDFGEEGGEFGDAGWLSERAFKPDLQNPSLSGNWIERVDGTFEEQLERVRRELLASNRVVRRSHKLAYVPVKTIKSLGNKYSRDLHVLHTPYEEIGLPSHAEIQGIHPEDRILQQKLADEASLTSAYPTE